MNWNLDRARPNWVLRRLADLYGLGLRFRSWAFAAGCKNTRRLPVPVIGVGNLTVGGTGKTPTVMLIARMLQDRGLRPAILSRGYGGRAPGPVNVVSAGQGSLLGPEAAGDEPCLLARSLDGVPVLTGPDRWTLGRYALDHFPIDILILDDGFQHLALARDLNLLLLDAGRPWGNGYLLPAGPLREPVDQAGRASAFILTRAVGEFTGLIKELKTRWPGRPVFTSRHVPVGLADLGGLVVDRPIDLQGRRVVAFCGLARPEVFFRTLTDLGAEVAARITWPDHHRPSARDLEAPPARARELGVDLLLTTAKDAVKLEAWDPGPGLNVRVLDVAMEIEPAGEFASLLEATGR